MREYKEKLEFWKDCEVVHLGKEGYRSLFRQYRTLDEAQADTAQTNEDYCICLNGNWKFHYCEDVNESPGDFWEDTFDDSAWNLIPVPGSWQVYGYGIPIYTNTIYPFQENSELLCPPYVPEDKNSKGIYRTVFTRTKKQMEEQTILRFDGVESAFYVWVNGHKIGFSQNTFSPAEFNITEYVREGENTLAVEVYRYCSCSYIEDQDMWRLSGIFRDVLLISEPWVRIQDFEVRTYLQNDYEDANLNVYIKILNNNMELMGPCTAEIRLFDDTGREIEEARVSGYTGMDNPLWPVNTWRKEDLARYKISNEYPKYIPANSMRTVYLNKPVKQPAKWTAETPYLYTLYVILKDNENNVLQVAKKRIGFRCIEEKEGRILINGRPIRFKGANIHEFHPEGGRTITREQMIHDILLLKRHNFNAVRCSHYPHAPIWYELCDEYGLYVMDECNMESHGISYKDDVLPGNDFRWTMACIDRAISCLSVSKNSPSVVVWSTSNEAGYGENIAMMAACIRALDDTRLIHERQMCYVADMDSDTYSGIHWLERKAQRDPLRPFILNEYAHSMGNAIGNFADYWETFEKYPNICGGFVWEWFDHGMIKVDEQGKKRYLYGGDFGDRPNSGNFIIDGVITPEREVTPKLLEMKRVQQYMKVCLVDASSGIIRVTNDHYHRSSNYLAMIWTVERDGFPQMSGRIDNLNLQSGETDEFNLGWTDELYCEAGEYFLNVEFVLKEECLWAPKGYLVAKCQMALKNIPAVGVCADHAIYDVQVKEDDSCLTLQSKDLSFVLNKETGSVVSLTAFGEEVLAPSDNTGLIFHAFRAFTDNDDHSRDTLSDLGWEKIGLNALESKVLDVRLLGKNPHMAEVAVHIQYLCKNDAGFHQYTVYAMDDSGRIQMKNTLQPYGNLPCLPKLGFEMTCSDARNQILWFGRGPQENYSDRKVSADVSRYSFCVDQEKLYYVMPQEAGNHEDVRWVAAMDQENRGIRVSSDRNFCFTATRYHVDDLQKTKHREDLVPRDKMFLSLDYKQHGLGNCSCGSPVMHKYKLFPETVSFNLFVEAFEQNPDGEKRVNNQAEGSLPGDVFTIDPELSIDISKFLDVEEIVDPSDKEARIKAGFIL